MNAFGNQAITTLRGNLGGGSLGGGIVVPPSVPETPLLDRTRQALDEAVKEMHGLIEDVRSFNESVHGPQSSGAIAGGNSPESIARADQIDQRIGWLRDSLGTLRCEVNRLRAI